MKKTDIQNFLEKRHNGSYTNITFLSDMTPNKDNKEHKIQKLISAVVRFGVHYSNIDAEEIRARRVVDDNGNPVSESRSPRHQRRVKYLLDGVEVSKEEVIPLTRGSEWTPRTREEFVFNPKIENVLKLGKETR